VNLPL